MKKLFSIVLIGFLFVGLYSCDPEPAPPVSDDLREEIDRKWYCELNDGESVYNFESVISLDPNNDNQILISNFNNQGSEAYAIVYDDYTIVLPKQTLEGTSTSVEGTADIDPEFTRINWEYEATDTEGSYTVNVAYTLSDIAKKLIAATLS
jgi:hypothetical protein